MINSVKIGWEAKTLGDFITLKRGFDILSKQLKKGKYKVIFSSGLRGTHNEYKVKSPGVVIGRKGTLGNVFYVDSDFWPTDTTLWVKDFHGNDPKFVYYFLKTMHLEQYDCGAANPTLNRNHIHPLPVKIPPLPTQRKIAGILSAYDDLIENNTRRIEILEEMARMLYREWFVKFRFPIAHDGDNTKGDRPPSTDGKNQAIALVESELGLIPEGWEVKRLEELTLVITKGTTPTTLGKKFQEQGINYLKVESIDNQGFILPEKLAKIDKETYDLLKKSKLKKGDILFSIAGAIGRVTLISSKFLPANINQALAIIRPSNNLLKLFLYRTIQSDNFVNFSLGRVVQTAQANVSLGVLKSAPIILPTEKLIEKFNNRSKQISELIDNLLEKNINLRKTRDLLLPRLISGEIDVEAMDIQCDRDLES